MSASVHARLERHAFCGDLHPHHLELLADCATAASFSTDELLLREGGEARTFYLVESGRVALEIERPGHGALLIETVEPDSVVGWSWLFPPYRWHFDARAVEAVSAIAIDGARVRIAAEAEREFGYELMRRISSVVLERLQATRIRLLDVYGDVRPR